VVKALKTVVMQHGRSWRNYKWQRWSEGRRDVSDARRHWRTAQVTVDI